MNSTGRLVSPLLAIALFCMAPAPAVAAEVRTSPDQAAQFVEHLGRQFETLLGGDGGGSLGQHRQAFATLVREGFDLELIGRFVLGHSWKNATAAQRQEYQRLYALWTINTYGLLLGANRGGHLTVIAAQPIGAGDAVVRTTIYRINTTPIEIDLRVRDSDGHMRIVEVLMAGASMGVTQRDEFASVIQHKGLDGLIGDLRGRVDTLQAEAARD